ncbi:MAG: hypothetical protein AMXMBFR33_12290 [Candidatus Xenobia bacterium]
MDLWSIQAAIKRRKWFFLMTFCAALLVAVLVPRGSTETVYVSMAKVLLTPPSGATYEGDGRGTTRWWFTDEATLNELVTSEELLRRVIAKLKLKTEWTELKEHITLSPVVAESGVGMYRYGQSSSLFQITVSASEPQLSREIATVVVEEFMTSIQDLSAREFANTRRFLEDLVREANQNAEKAGSKLAAITSKRNTTSDERDVMSTLNELEAQRLSTREQLTKLEAEQDSVNSFLGDPAGTPPWSLLREQGAIQNLEQTVAENRVKLAEAQQYYTPDSPEVREQTTRLEKIQQLYTAQVVKAAQSVVSEKSTQSGALQSQLAQIEEQIDNLRATQLTPEERRDVAQLERELAVWEENRLALIKQLYQARVVEQSSRRQGAISILLRPTDGVLPRDKRLPSLLRSLAVGIPFALVVSLGLLILADFMSRSLQLLPRVEEALEAPILVVVPRFPKGFSEEWDMVKSGLEPRVKK